MSDTEIAWPNTREPYNYQREGVNRLVERGGGFLWDDPGLGKTVQALVAARELGGAPWLIVCPNALKRWWARELRQVFPEDRHQIITSTVGGRFLDPKEHSKVEVLPHYLHKRGDLPKWVITHYAGLRVSEQSYGQVNWSGVIVDEAHYIKNIKARRTQAVINTTPRYAYRIGLTATPIGINPADLWSQLIWMAPDVKGLQSYWRWFNLFVDYSWEEVRHPGGRITRYRKIKGGKNLDMLSKVMHAYGLQRSKSEVAPQLPPVTQTEMPLEPTPREVVISKALAEKDRVELVIKNTSEDRTTEDAPFTGLLIKNTLSRLVKMEQWLSHPWTFDPGTMGAKLTYLLEWAKQYQLPAVIATRFRASASRIAKELKVIGGGCQRAIMGGLPQKFRDDIIDDWSAGKQQYLVGTINTIGTGLNLQRAHLMICYDQVYSSISMEQLYQRIHRIDSDHPVEIVYLYIEGSTNELVLRSWKERWSQMLLVRNYLAMLQEKSNDISIR